MAYLAGSFRPSAATILSVAFFPPLAPAVSSRRRGGLCHETSLTAAVRRPVHERGCFRRRTARRGYPGRRRLDKYSSIELHSASIAQCVRKAKQHGPYQLVTVGSLAQLYKGTDVLIEAVARCVRAGFDLTAMIVGDGKYRRDLIAQAERLGMASRVRFPGQVTAGEPVRRILDAANLFVLPSRTEGLPRALIEAMARALPCIGSAVGGIPELLDASDLVPAGDAAALAAKIQEVVRDPLRMETMSRRNLAGARKFCGSALAERRRRFYKYVRDYTQRWEARQKA